MRFLGFNIQRRKSLSYPQTAELEGSKYVYYLTVPVGFNGSRVAQNIDTTTKDGQLNAYSFCPPLSTIITKKVQACNNGIYQVSNRKGDIVDIDIPLMIKPNPLQTWQQFQTQALTALQVFGETFIYKLKASQYSKNIAALWVVPNTGMTVNTTGKLFNQTSLSEIITGYTYKVNGEVIQEFTVDEIEHVKDVLLSPVDSIHGYSRLSTILDPVQNVIAAYEARNVLITKKGAIGILSNGSKDGFGGVPLTAGERDDLQNAFREYGISKDKYQVIMTNANMSWQSMTFPTKDLMLFEEIEDDVREMANTFGYPFPLLFFKNQSALGDGAMIDAANIVLYQDTVIPEMKAWTQVLSRLFNISSGYILTCSFTHLPIFQEDQQAAAAALNTLNQAYSTAYTQGIVTREEWREAIGLDPVKFNGQTFANNEQPI
jgi:HK97 family phage portal protein